MELDFYHKKMEVELRNFMIVWLIVLLSLSYCYAIGKKTSKGINRFLFMFPIIVLFVFLPFHLYSFHLNFLTFFSITWLGNSKLLFFAFGMGPLSSDPYMSLAVFLAVASLPIKLQQYPAPNKEHPSPKKSKNGSLVIYAIKGSLLAIMVYLTKHYSVYDLMEVMFFSTALHTYLILDMTLSLTSTMVGALLGLSLEPNFDAPFLSTSLQNFWGRRWNRMASNILRLTVYEPTKKKFTPVLGRRWATSPAILATFLASGLMHELMFYHFMHLKPTGEVTSYFLLHGTCVAVEIELKKTLKKWRLPWLISRPSVVGFVLVTTSWLLFAPLKRSKVFVRVLDEFEAVVTVLENVGWGLDLYI